MHSEDALINEKSINPEKFFFTISVYDYALNGYFPTIIVYSIIPVEYTSTL